MLSVWITFDLFGSLPSRMYLPQFPWVIPSNSELLYLALGFCFLTNPTGDIIQTEIRPFMAVGLFGWAALNAIYVLKVVNHGIMEEGVAVT